MQYNGLAWLLGVPTSSSLLYKEVRWIKLPSLFQNYNHMVSIMRRLMHFSWTYADTTLTVSGRNLKRWSRKHLQLQTWLCCEQRANEQKKERRFTSIIFILILDHFFMKELAMCTRKNSLYSQLWIPFPVCHVESRST